MSLRAGVIRGRRPTYQQLEDELEGKTSDYESSPDVTPLRSYEEPHRKAETEKPMTFGKVFSKRTIICALFCAVISIAALYLFYRRPALLFTTCDIIVLDEELSRLKEDFKSQTDDDWLLLSAGIEKISFPPPRPSTFVLIYQNNTATAERLALRIGSIASRYLTNCSDKGVIILKGSEIGDHLIERYKSQLHLSHVMIIHGLEQMNAEKAAPFHSLCDEFNPVVKKSAFFFTLQINHSTREYSASKTAKKRLYDLWKNSRDELVSGLVTRLTNIVIEINED